MKVWEQKEIEELEEFKQAIDDPLLAFCHGLLSEEEWAELEKPMLNYYGQKEDDVSLILS